MSGLVFRMLSRQWLIAILVLAPALTVFFVGKFALGDGTSGERTHCRWTISSAPEGAPYHTSVCATCHVIGGSGGGYVCNSTIEVTSGAYTYQVSLGSCETSCINN